MNDVFQALAAPARRAILDELHDTDGQTLMEDGIPFTSFAVDDVRAEHQRLTQRGVRFPQNPTEMGPVTMAVLDDTCGNLIQIVSHG